jgi:uncharacterized protein YbjQ (UPF0145 family)
MQISASQQLDGDRLHFSIGRIKATSRWCGSNGQSLETSRREAVAALIKEAEAYDADAIIGLDFEIDDVKGADIDGTRLRCVRATGIAVKFALAA